MIKLDVRIILQGRLRRCLSQNVRWHECWRAICLACSS